VRWRADQRKELEQLCRYITRPAIANERLKRNRTGQVVLQLKSPYKDGTTHIVMEPLTVWQEYLPMRREIRNLSSLFIPDAAIAEIKKATHSFERIEIWSRAGDPMAVGIIGEEKLRWITVGCGFTFN
jgi:hypothetical protein